ncbi:MAG: TonB-dependent receptor [Opitutales bacterium]|nr:TonB-dependent receptor [Opitutales bacterium]
MTNLAEFPCITNSGTRLIYSLRFAMASFCLGLFLLAPASFAAKEAAKNDEEETTESEAHTDDNIVSQKDEVKLVDDSSVAEAVKRRPDLNFANVTIDGESSGVSLSSLQAEDVESVEVMKAVTPDLDADSRGGSISLKTRPSYAQSRRATSVEGSLYYDSLDSAKGYRGKLSFSGPINKARTLGARASVTYRDSPYFNNTLYQDWQSKEVEGKNEFVLRDTGIGTFQRTTKEFEYSVALDYKLSDTINLYLRNTAEFTDYHTAYNVNKFRFFRGDYLQVDEQGANVESADVRNSIWRYDTRSDEVESTVGGTYEKDHFVVDFKLTYKDDEIEYLNYFTADFVQDDVDLRYDLFDPKFPTTTVTNESDLDDLSRYEFEDLVDRYYFGDESDTISAINIKWDDLFEKRNAFIKLGYKSRVRDYSRITQYDIYDDYDGSFSIADVPSDLRFPDLLDGRYVLENIADGEDAQTFFEDNIDSFTLNERRTRENSDPNNYTVNETVNGIYGMINMELGNWRAILGVRNEETSIDFIGNEVLLDQNELGETVYVGTNSIPGESSYDNLFPNAHFRYKLSDTITLIGSYTQTIDRPAYTYIVPYRRVNLEEQEIEEGNPDLKPTIYTNYDLSVDVELPSHALLSVELFNRSVEDFVFSQKQILSSGIYQGFELESYENSASADIQGATFTWRQPLDTFHLPEGLSLNANYTKQKSEIEYPARPGETLPLTRMPDNELKLTLSYQNEKFFAQVRYAYEDLVPSRIAGNPDEDLYYLENGQVDLSLTYQLRKNVRLFADVQNLTNEPYYDRYEGDSSRPAGFRHLPWTMSSGVRVEL